MIKSICRNLLFFACLFVIVAVSSRDVYLSIKLQNVLYECEQNPVGKLLMDMDSKSVALFMSLKTFGTAFVASFLMYLFLKNIRYAMTITIGVTVFQICLLSYLEMG